MFKQYSPGELAEAFHGLLQLLPEADGVALKVLDDILCEILQELLTKALGDREKAAIIWRKMYTN